jgi:hypothetical protein
MTSNRLTYSLILGAGLMFGGCYTQFSTLNSSAARPPQAIPEIMVDSAGDTIRVVREKDTITVTNNEVCYWERDLFGQPKLRCYRSFYGNDWNRYSYRPWWQDSYYGSDYYSPYGSYNYPFAYDSWYYNDYYHNRRNRYDYDYNSPGNGSISEKPKQSSGSITQHRGGSGIPLNESTRDIQIVGPRPELLPTAPSGGPAKVTAPATVQQGSIRLQTTPPPPPSTPPQMGSGGSGSTVAPERPSPPPTNTDQSTQRRYGRRR